MALANDYAVARQNIFFTANGQTPADGNLTGQCVTLVKWFMQDCTRVPSPFNGRGDARYVGKTLVAQGHAIEVPYADRREGDIVCYEFGIYGHIAVQLSGGRVFEENVNMGGVARKLITEGSESWYVYASRIGSEAESWRIGKNAHVYRILSYNGDTDMKATANDLKYLYLGVYAVDTPADILAKDPFIGTDFGYATSQVLDYANTKGIAYWQYKPKAEKEIADLKKRVTELEAGQQYVETKVYIKKVG